MTGFEMTGRGLLSSTRLRGRYAIRMCVMNHTSGPSDVRETLEWFADAEAPALPARGEVGEPRDRHPDVRGGWADAAEFDEPTVRGVPLFADLEDDAIEVVLGSARRLDVAAGETVVHRWHGTRHFYVIASGAIEIQGSDGEVLRELGPGGYFGELAALDWGAGFGYARTADAVARSDCRLLVLAPASLAELFRRAPQLEPVLRTAARERVRNL